MKVKYYFSKSTNYLYNVRNKKYLQNKITQINYKKMSVKKHSDEAKKKISESQKKRYQNMSAEKKTLIPQHYYKLNILST